MKYTDTLKCSVEEVWKALETSLMYEMEEATSKKLVSSDLKAGISYQKKMNASRGGAIHTEVLIKEFEKNKKYTAQFTTYEGVNTLSYSLEKVSDTECLVTYEENYSANKKLNGWNAKLVSIVLGFSHKNKVKKIFKNIENYVVSQREAE